MEVIAHGGEGGVNAVAMPVRQIIPAHTVLGLHVADGWLDSGMTVRVLSRGIRCHASTPQEGKNAINRLVKEIGLDDYLH